MEVLGRRRQPRVYLNKARVVTLIEEVHSRRRIAQMMNVNHSAISRAWIRHYYYYYYYCKADSQVYKLSQLKKISY
jgi:IS30 family transposase